MTYENALRLCYVIFALSIVSLAIVIATFVLHLQVPSGQFRLLMGVGYLWPGAAFAIAWFRKKIEQQG